MINCNHDFCCNQDENETSENLIVVTEQFLNENSEILEVSNTIAHFLNKLDNR